MLSSNADTLGVIEQKTEFSDNMEASPEIVSSDGPPRVGANLKATEYNTSVTTKSFPEEFLGLIRNSYVSPL